MATTSARLLTLLSLLVSRPTWSGPELADRLGISTRSLRRDVDSLRELGYDVRAVRGAQGGYRFDAGRLPPLLLDDEQALAIAVALQTAPSSVSGMDEAIARALTSLKQIMPVRLRAEADAMHLTTLRNYWEFAAPPVSSDTLKTVGAAVRNATVLTFDHLTPDGRRSDPHDPEFVLPIRVEPHELVMWAGRWYLVGYDLGAGAWGVYRLNRIHAHRSAGPRFGRRDLPGGDVARFVTASWDRGDTPAQWPCVGTVLIELPAEVVAPWVPGGSVVEPVSATQSRFTVGAWSWAGVAGLIATFDSDFEVLGPDELRQACSALAQRSASASVAAADLSDYDGAPAP
ncbi:helix-turn-helix transcriptional regulator [uncultured Friedmanniella sp.]|uniref:helix-turn-helix transcriptional regulator n=1 Tax=uncultured Friedmanniella sp. TaxID=335381 RepID=UPI0035CC50AF